jgi:hypothetical protein
MKTNTYYEWLVETIDSDGDVVDVEPAESRAHAESMAASKRGAVAVLTRSVHCAIDGDQLDRQYAYPSPDGKLPTVFDGGSLIPAKFHKS